MISAAAFSSCGRLNSLNSFSSDAEVYDNSISTQFVAARQLMASKCAVCHRHSQFTSYSESEWVSVGLVVAGNPNASELFLRLKNNGILGSEQDMPPNSSLSTSEAQIIEDWIDSL